MNSEARSAIFDAARATGFDLCGIAPVELPPQHVEAWRGWIGAGRHGEMRYMERAERADLRKLAPWVKSVICLGLNYWLPEEQRGVSSGTISIYAQGRDYHDVMQEKMERLLNSLWQLPTASAKDGFEAAFQAKIYVDTGAILERAYAEAAGLGWIGKNTCLINEQRGSWFFLGEILTSLELPPETAPPDRCGTCTACLDACPTGAFSAPYQLDARKCISYQTIELRGAIPEEDRAGIGTHIFGCDICQDVCPWNNRSGGGAMPTNTAEFAALEVLREAASNALPRLASVNQTEFQQAFRDSPIKRAKHHGFLRNVAVALGNSGKSSALPLLHELAANPDPVIREHSRWALKKMES